MLIHNVVIKFYLYRNIIFIQWPSMLFPLSLKAFAKNSGHLKLFLNLGSKFELQTENSGKSDLQWDRINFLPVQSQLNFTKLLLTMKLGWRGWVNLLRLQSLSRIWLRQLCSPWKHLRIVKCSIWKFVQPWCHTRCM